MARFNYELMRQQEIGDAATTNSQEGLAPPSYF